MKTPLVHQTSWLMLIPPLLALGLALFAATHFIDDTITAFYVGAGGYLVYLMVSRGILLGHHRRGLKSLNQQNYDDAIRSYQRGYDFFQRHSWVDRYRAITMMSASSMSFREMALCNIAFALGQKGDGAGMRKKYEQALSEFPESLLAATSLRMIAALDKSGDT